MKPGSEILVSCADRIIWVRVEGNGSSKNRLPAEKLVEGVSAPETLAALSAGTVPPGMAMSIIDGQFLIEPPEAALAAGRQAMVPVIIGANDRELALGTANSKDGLFAIFGPDAERARSLYDPRGDQTLDELKQQVFADKTLVEPTRHFANEMARCGQLMGAMHGFEIPFTMNIPAALTGEKRHRPTRRWEISLAPIGCNSG